jgi:hypothetical protein
MPAGLKLPPRQLRFGVTCQAELNDLVPVLLESLCVTLEGLLSSFEFFLPALQPLSFGGPLLLPTFPKSAAQLYQALPRRSSLLAGTSHFISFPRQFIFHRAALGYPGSLLLLKQSPSLLDFFTELQKPLTSGLQVSRKLFLLTVKGCLPLLEVPFLFIEGGLLGRNRGSLNP